MRASASVSAVLPLQQRAQRGRVNALLSPADRRKDRSHKCINDKGERITKGAPVIQGVDKVASWQQFEDYINARGGGACGEKGRPHQCV